MDLSGPEETDWMARGRRANARTDTVDGEPTEDDGDDDGERVTNSDENTV